MKPKMEREKLRQQIRRAHQTKRIGPSKHMNRLKNECCAPAQLAFSGTC